MFSKYPLPKAIYRFTAVSSKILVAFPTEIEVEQFYIFVEAEAK